MPSVPEKVFAPSNLSPEEPIVNNPVPPNIPVVRPPDSCNDPLSVIDPPVRVPMVDRAAPLVSVRRPALKEPSVTAPAVTFPPEMLVEREPVTDTVPELIPPETTASKELPSVPTAV
jgi:hypothetical protein